MQQRQYLVGTLKILDLVVMLSCFVFAALLVMPGFDADSIREFMGMRIKIGNFFLLASFIGLWYLVFSSFGLYDGSLLSHTIHNSFDVLKATATGTGIIVALSAPIEISFVGARFILVFWACVSVAAIVCRLVAREIVRRHNLRQENRHRVLVIGVNARSVNLARQFETDFSTSGRIIGFVDDTAEHAESFGRSGYELVSNYGGLKAYLGKTAVDEVLICLPIKSRSDDISNVVEICEEQGIAVGVVPDLFNLDLASTTARQVGSQTIITMCPHAIHGRQAAAKRLIDVVVSAVMLVLLSPVFIVTAVLIKLDSPGPVFFSQERVGLNKKNFRIFKFRTMVPDAMERQVALEQFNEAAGPIFKIKGDPRITGIGKFLRRSSIDELPQLVNVLNGDMSLVGPRPLPVRDYQGFTKDWHRRRVCVRPGITGLWQVSGRDQGSFDDWVRLDLEYIDGWSLVLDAKVLLMTIPAVLGGKGAV